MNLEKLYEILNDTTIQLRKGEVVSETDKDGLHVVTIDAMPHVDEARPDIEKVDLELLVIGVDRKKAEEHRAEFVALMDDYPEPERLAGGPSYIEVGAEIGSQGAAFQLFALGQTLGLWKIITPSTLGFTGEDAREMAGRGFIMITGYVKDRKAA